MCLLWNYSESMTRKYCTTLDDNIYVYMEMIGCELCEWMIKMNDFTELVPTLSKALVVGEDNFLSLPISMFVLAVRVSRFSVFFPQFFQSMFGFVYSRMGRHWICEISNHNPTDMTEFVSASLMLLCSQ